MTLSTLPKEFRRGRSVVCSLQVHLVFVTKYRRGVFNDDLLDVCKTAMEQVCADFDVHLVEFNGEDDHVHLLIEYPPTLQLSRLVNSLKGVSARMLRKQRSSQVSNLEPAAGSPCGQKIVRMRPPVVETGAIQLNLQ